MYDINQVSFVFDSLISKVKKELEERYKAKAITKNDVANILSAVIPSIVNESMNAPIRDIQLKQEEIKLKILEEELKLKALEVGNQKLNKERLAIDMKIAKEKSLRELTLLDAEVDKAKALIKESELNIGIKLHQKDLTATQVEKEKRAIELTNQEVINKKAEFEAIVANKLMTDRQIKGFDDNLMMNLLRDQLNNWAMMFTSGLLTDDEGNSAVPSIIRNDEVSTLYRKILDSICCSGEQYCKDATSYFIQKHYCETDIFGDGSCEALFPFDKNLKSKD